MLELICNVAILVLLLDYSYQPSQTTGAYMGLNAHLLGVAGNILMLLQIKHILLKP